MRDQSLWMGRLGFQIYLFNMNSDQNIRSVSAVKPVPMERVYLAVAKHLKDGIYNLDSINASEYSFIIVCRLQVSEEEFRVSWKSMFAPGE